MNRLILVICCMCLFGACQDEEKNGSALKPVVTESEFLDIRDNDTIVYKCITVGGQTWMAENLKYKVAYGPYSGCHTYGVEIKQLQAGTLNTLAMQMYMYGMISKDVYTKINTLYKAGKDYPEILETLGDEIPSILLDQFFAADVNKDYFEQYGYLYNLEAALKAVPEGWRLPTDEDWKILEKNLGISDGDLNGLNVWRGSVQGRLLKEGEDGIGFNAKLGGGRVYGTGLTGSTYMRLGSDTYFWSSTLISQNDSTNFALIRSVKVSEDRIYRGTTKLTDVAFAVRCIKK